MLKRILLGAAVLCAAGSAAAQYGRCSYTPLQDAIRTARSEQQIQELINKGVRLDEQTRCGGSLLQLAIVRGNPAVISLMLRQNPELARTPVALSPFPIQGAPAEVPVLMFAARYAVRPEIVTGLINAGASATELDKNGENILWYLSKNPVLVDTELADQLRDVLLYQPKSVETPTLSAAPQRAAVARQPQPQPQPPSQPHALPQSTLSVPAPSPTPMPTPAVQAVPLGSPIVPSRAQPVELVEKSMPVRL
ncbi:MAG: hypothetical protein PHX68_03620 [Alphaproteobacteria bacterium]|nr:hypothetical protein [Alphaproteobacteria bacterium]